jgi:hypothetical protein
MSLSGRMSKKKSAEDDNAYVAFDEAEGVLPQDE